MKTRRITNEATVATTAVALMIASLPLSVQAADLVATPYAPPAGYGTPPCFAAFYAGLDAEGPSLARHGPEEVPVIRHLRYANGRSLKFRVRSVTTSPGAIIELYDRKNYRRLVSRVGPGSMINLKHPVVDSYRLICEAPASAPPVYAPPMK